MWRTSFLDLDHTGSWSWQVEPGTLRKIIAFLREMERLTWTQVRAQLTGGNRPRGPTTSCICLEILGSAMMFLALLFDGITRAPCPS